METPKEYHYTYYSYEEWGRGYFGSRTCKCLPEEDIKYFGSFYDKIFKPTQKIILKDDYATREEAYADEIILHDFYDVANNPHFANQSKQTCTKFCYTPSFEEASERAKRLNKIQKELGIGIFSFTKEQLSEYGKKGGTVSAKKQKELGLGLYSLTKEEKSEAGKKSGAQRWICEDTGFVSNAAGVIRYQTKRGIDTSKRKRVA